MNQELLDKHLGFYVSLDIGRRSPDTEEQKHFVKVCCGEEEAFSDDEKTYVEFRIAFPLRHKEALGMHRLSFFDKSEYNSNGNSGKKKVSSSELTMGATVRHRIKGYIGILGEITEISRYFEKETDECGLCVNSVRMADGSVPGKTIKFHGQGCLIASPDFIDPIQNYPLEDAHRFKMKVSGQQYRGSKKVSGHRHRVANCYACRGKLNSRHDLECNSCNWITCSCGACGCGYEGYQ